MLTFVVVLHPSHKLEYFKTADWNNEWREMALDIVQTEFEHSYADIEVAHGDEGPEVCSDFFHCSLHFFLKVLCDRM